MEHQRKDSSENNEMRSNTNESEHQCEKAVGKKEENAGESLFWKRGVFVVIGIAIISCTLFQTPHIRAHSVAESTTVQRPIEEEVRRKLDSSSGGSSSRLDDLDENSIVVITGAAGFIGSNLAMALHSTYNPKKLILIDTLDTHPAWAEMRASSASARTPDEYSQKVSHTASRASSFTEEELARLEYKRQRLFHLLQTIGDKCIFYKSDIRPSIPEFWDLGEVPLLEMVFRQYPGITHVVHLADSVPENARGDADQAVPRVKDQTKAGMMESVLERLREVAEGGGRVPHFVYASTHEVYDRMEWREEEHAPPPTPHRETEGISAPSSLRGAAKLMDEILASSYQTTYGIFSVGLRFFSVYGPWGSPTSTIFQMAERAVSDAHLPLLPKSLRKDGDAVDYVFIDDAVDAILAAMQYRPVKRKDATSVVFNVGTGSPTSYRAVHDMIQYYFPRADGGVLPEDTEEDPAFISIADTNLARIHLGFTARTKFKDGLIQLLAWHYDRATPYGGNTPLASMNPNTKTSDAYHNAFIASHGVQSCNPLDQECLKGTPVFPCCSECSNEALCLPTIYDYVIKKSQKLTEGCTHVMYTVSLSDDIKSIPSAKFGYMPNSPPHIISDKGKCNIAFVSENSHLVQSLKTTTEDTLQHGFWTLVPLPYTSTTIAEYETHLPKYTPQKFFAKTVRYAIYADPDVLFTSLPSLLNQLESSIPRHLKDNILLPLDGSIALLTSYKDNSHSPKIQRNTGAARMQERAYNTFRIGLRGELRTTSKTLDDSWLVYALMGEDKKSFRCDVFAEMVQWKVTGQTKGLYFIATLHDLWTRSLSKWNNNERGVDTVTWRRLQRDDEGEKEEDDEEDDKEEDTPEQKEGADGVLGILKDASDEEEEEENGKGEEEEEEDDGDWFGMLSSTSNYFVRILPVSEAHVVHLTQYTSVDKEDGSGVVP